jgi:hypothetical protein
MSEPMTETEGVKSNELIAEKKKKLLRIVQTHIIRLNMKNNNDGPSRF